MPGVGKSILTKSVLANTQMSMKDGMFISFFFNGGGPTSGDNKNYSRRAFECERMALSNGQYFQNLLRFFSTIRVSRPQINIDGSLMSLALDGYIWVDGSCISLPDDRHGQSLDSSGQVIRKQPWSMDSTTNGHYSDYTELWLSHQLVTVTTAGK
jgi:hypothetical protein